jgi:hypothetical protein
VFLIALLIVFMTRLVRTRRAPRSTPTMGAPTHVRDLDIRPESLPDDIGAAARDLWDRGEHRPALALLYRGLLSRLAHVHHAAIRDSSTEGDCLAVAERHLAPAKFDYASRLVRVWQHAVYGAEAAEPSQVYLLCDGFAAALDPTALAGSGSPGEAR